MQTPQIKTRAFYHAKFCNLLRENRMYPDLMEKTLFNSSFESLGEPYKVYRGVEVHGAFSSWYFVHDGLVITERVGITEAERLIDLYFDKGSEDDGYLFYAAERMRKTYKEASETYKKLS